MHWHRYKSKPKVFIHFQSPSQWTSSGGQSSAASFDANIVAIYIDNEKIHTAQIADPSDEANTMAISDFACIDGSANVNQIAQTTLTQFAIQTRQLSSICVTLSGTLRYIVHSKTRSPDFWLRLPSLIAQTGVNGEVVCMMNNTTCGELFVLNVVSHNVY